MCGPYRGKLLEFGESVLAHVPEVRKGPGNPRRSWMTDVNPPCGWARATSRTNVWSQTDEGAVYARSVQRLAEHSWSGVKLRAVVDTPQKPKSTTVDIFLQPRLSLFLLQHQKYLKMRRRKTKKCRESRQTQKMKPGASSSSRGEKRTEAQEATSVKERGDEDVINRERNSHVCR